MVAGEARHLSQRTPQAAREIKRLDTFNHLVASEAVQAEAVEGNMSELTSAFRQVNDLVSEIGAIAEKYNTGMTQVHLAASQMDDVTQQNALIEVASARAVSRDFSARKPIPAVPLNTLARPDRDADWQHF